MRAEREEGAIAWDGRDDPESAPLVSLERKFCSAVVILFRL